MRLIALLLCVALLGCVTLAQRSPTSVPVSAAPTCQLRSQHFVHGMPTPSDDRHRMPNGQLGVTVLVRYDFVVGHYDKMKVSA